MSIDAIIHEARVARARLIWYGLNPHEQASVEEAWQLGSRRFPEGSNPYSIESDAWQWAAFEMGWQEADRLNR